MEFVCVFFMDLGAKIIFLFTQRYKIGFYNGGGEFSVCRNGAGLPPYLISTNTTVEGSYSASLGSFMLPPIRLLI